MPNPKNRKTISILVREDYPASGAEARDEIIKFFQYLVDRAPEAVLAYPGLDAIKEVLTFV
jgi:hypothetical protein